MSNYSEIIEIADEVDEVMAKVDENFKGMSKGGIHMSLNFSKLTFNLKKANKLFKKLDTISSGDDFTDEEKAMIEAKAKELTNKYNHYYKLIEEADKAARNFLKKDEPEQTAPESPKV